MFFIESIDLYGFGTRKSRTFNGGLPILEGIPILDNGAPAQQRRATGLGRFLLRGLCLGWLLFDLDGLQTNGAILSRYSWDVIYSISARFSGHTVGK